MPHCSRAWCSQARCLVNSSFLARPLSATLPNSFMIAYWKWRLRATSSPGQTQRSSGERMSISDRAILYGANLRLDDPLELADRLYAFNRKPTNLAQMRAGEDRVGFRRFLGLTDGDDFDGFRELRQANDRPAWMEWRRAGRAAIPAPTTAYKLYVCVQPEAIPLVFKACALTVAQQGACGFKIAANLSTLNRPDKFIIYFDTVSALQAGARDLAVVLADVEPHELPFGGTLTVTTLAWGIDPPRNQGNPGASWRSWVCGKVAGALLGAMSGGAEPAEAVVFTKRRIALDGLDPGSWAPDRVRFE